ncbi:MAG TPA: TrmH family RNA methyltransferase, partial [Candidatus Acetothermia bacterium]|nr:TrmH family RNA methyltransferase [Candidatus Acetothermia bacterium]
AKIERVVASRLGGLACVCENFEKPHNAAAILRTCEAIGVLNVYVVEQDFPFEPSKGVTQGADKWLFIKRFRRWELALEALRREGYLLYAATPDPKGLALEELPTRGKLALVFGNEATGISPQVLHACAGTFWVPMWGFSQSLNVSVAAAISLYHCAQARRHQLGRPGDLSPAEREALRQHYLRLSLPPAGGGG